MQQDFITTVATGGKVGNGHLHVGGSTSSAAGLGSVKLGYCHNPSLCKISLITLAQLPLGVKLSLYPSSPRESLSFRAVSTTGGTMLETSHSRRTRSLIADDLRTK